MYQWLNNCGLSQKYNCTNIILYHIVLNVSQLLYWNMEDKFYCGKRENSRWNILPKYWTGKTVAGWPDLHMVLIFPIVWRDSLKLSLFSIHQLKSPAMQELFKKFYVYKHGEHFLNYIVVVSKCSSEHDDKTYMILMLWLLGCLSKTNANNTMKKCRWCDMIRQYFRMSYYRYITGVYKSYLPGLNRTLRSSSVPRTVLPLDTSEFSTIKDNRINLTYWSKELDRWLVSLDNKVVSHLKIGPFQKSLINNHFQHLQFQQRWFFFFLFVVFSSLEQAHLSL